jgi:serine/threonine protein kinase/WD40 repeat protein
LLRLGFTKTGDRPDTIEGPDLPPVVVSDVVRRIGPYTLVRKIGEGGMGVVYLAEQRDPIRRTVALKLIKLDMDRAEVVSRFESERQALALMDHPNIAHVYEAGATPDGRPYFVMEYVPGSPISDYCDAHQLTVRERVELMMTVCGAIHHAHQKGIIHRDLKPSNILVAEAEGRAVPKVIDFGVAKAVDRVSAGKSQFTLQGRVIGTIGYMSPEQADPAAVDLDTRTDIYALGVILYETLVGALPFSPARLRHAGQSEMLRIIRDEDPPRPSVKVRTGDTASEAPSRRRTTLSGLSAQLRGDLDWIALKALDKERTRRYASASEFSADLGRYLNNEPILARPAAAAYRLRKFVRRNRLIVTAASLILASVVAGLVVSTLLYIRERTALRDAQRARQEASNNATAEAHARSAAQAATAAEAQARAQADDQRAIAQKALATAETNLYFDNIDLADREAAAFNTRRVDELLAAAPERLRNWEWHYLHRLSHMEAAAIPLPGGAAITVGTEPESDRYLAAMRDMRVIIGHVSSARIERVVKLEDPSERTMSIVPMDRVFSDDGRRLVVATHQSGPRGPSTVTVWDSVSGRALLTVRPGSVFSLALNRSGTLLATKSWPSPPNFSATPVRLWNVDAGTEIGAITPVRAGEPAGGVSGVEGLRFSPDSSRLAIYTGWSIRIIDVSSGRQVVEVPTVSEGGAWAGWSLAFSPDGSRIAGGMGDGTVSVWAVDDGVKVASLRPRQPVIPELGRPTRPIFSRDNRYLIVALGDSSLCVFDVATGREVQRLTGSTRLGDLATTGSHQVVSTGDQLLRVWNLPEAEREDVVSVPTRTTHYVAASPDRTILAAVGGTGDIRTWRVSSLSTAASLEISSAPGVVSPPSTSLGRPDGALSINRDGSRVMVGRGLLVQDGSGHAITTNEYAVLDSLTGHEIAHFRPLRHGGDEIKDVQSWFAREGLDRNRIHDRIRELSQYIPFTLAAGLSPDGDRAAILTLPRTTAPRRDTDPSILEIWDVNSGKVVRRELSGLSAHGGWVRFSPRGDRVVMPNAAEVLDARTGRTISRLPKNASPLVFDATGERLLGETGGLFAQTGNTIGLWEALTGRLLMSVVPPIPVADAAFSPDGTRAALVSPSGIVAVVECTTGRVIATLRESSGPYRLREIIVTDGTRDHGSLPTSWSQYSTVRFSQDGMTIEVTTVANDPRGARVQFRSWTAKTRKPR